MTYRFAAGIVILLAGCPVGVADDQEIDASGGTDSPPATSGLTITWGVSPEVPGPVATDLRVEEVRLSASSLRIIGDSAPPGDMRTTRAPIDLRWHDNQGTSEGPLDVELGAAPPGLYSRIELGTGGSEESIFIEGEVRIDGGGPGPGNEWRDFEIRDQRSHPIIKDMVLALAPGQHTTIPCSVNIAAILAVVPWSDLENDGGTLRYREDDPRLDAIWVAVDASFTIPASFIDRD